MNKRGIMSCAACRPSPRAHYRRFNLGAPTVRSLSLSLHPLHTQTNTQASTQSVFSLSALSIVLSLALCQAALLSHSSRARRKTIELRVTDIRLLLPETSPSPALDSILIINGQSFLSNQARYRHHVNSE